MSMGKAFLISLFAAQAAQADGYVVGHVTVNVAPEEVREIYLGNKQFADSLRLAPVHNGAVQGEFLYSVIRMDPDRYSALWTKKSFREGGMPPPTLLGDAEVLDFVRRTPGAIGYVGADPGRANIIFKY
jgi:hypothetical protein